MFWKFSLSTLECRAYTLLIKNLEVGAETCCQQNALKDKDIKTLVQNILCFSFPVDEWCICKVIASLEY